MPRPRRKRRVLSMPKSKRFGAHEPFSPFTKEVVIMTVDEYEVIRLIDLEGLTQEECAEVIGIARTTVQKMYSDARTKIADMLVNSKILQLEGGEYILSDENGR